MKRKHEIGPDLVRRIANIRKRIAPGRAVLIGISGIDASGKGYIAGGLASNLEAAGYRVALINVDGWLNLPNVRFLNAKRPSHEGESDRTREGTHFYHHALRLDEMFSDLVLPLKKHGSIELTMDFAEETATEFRPYTYEFSEIDIVILEGIFIFKRRFTEHFDQTIWVECSFETALHRAIARSQEGLSAAETIYAFETTYFPAQRMHFERDQPRIAAHLIYRNDDRQISKKR